MWLFLDVPFGPAFGRPGHLRFGGRGCGGEGAVSGGSLSLGGLISVFGVSGLVRRPIWYIICILSHFYIVRPLPLSRVPRAKRLGPRPEFQLAHYCQKFVCVED